MLTGTVGTSVINESIGLGKWDILNTSVDNTLPYLSNDKSEFDLFYR